MMRTRTPVNTDRMAMVPRQRAADVAHEALFPVQALDPSEMVLGIAVLFAAVSHRCQLDPEALYRMGRKVLFAEERFHKRTNDSLQSLQDFAGLRIAGQETSLS